MKEISKIINQNMDSIKSILTNSNESVNINNQLNTIDKNSFINYNGENISIISNNNNHSFYKEKLPESKNIIIIENISSKNKINNKNEVKKNSLNNKDLLSNNSTNFPLFDSNSTSNTSPKKINKILKNKINNITVFSTKLVDNNINCKNNLKINEAEFIKFFLEINLPSLYAFKLIENGFDDFNILIEMTKSGIAISNKNLKDIGITKAGERAKILIYLEKKAGVFLVILDKKILFYIMKIIAIVWVSF